MCTEMDFQSCYNVCLVQKNLDQVEPVVQQTLNSIYVDAKKGFYQCIISTNHLLHTTDMLLSAVLSK